MRRRHLRGVVAIEQQTSHRPWSEALFASELGQRTSRCVVAVAPRSVVVGFGCLMSTGFEAHVTNLAVHPDHRREGVGRRLLAALVGHAVALGLDDVTLEVRSSNHAARELYRRFGFAPGGVRRNYYAELGEDALIMWAHGIGDPAYARRLEELSRVAGPMERSS